MSAACDSVGGEQVHVFDRSVGGALYSRSFDSGAFGYDEWEGLFDWFASNMFVLPHQQLLLESQFNLIDIYGDNHMHPSHQELVLQQYVSCPTHACLCPLTFTADPRCFMVCAELGNSARQREAPQA